MASLADIGDAVKNWYHANIIGPESVPAFFQSRATRTPGVVTPLDASRSGSYDPTMSPGQEANRNPVTAGMWSGSQPGMMAVQPGIGQGNDQGTIKHEEWHDIFNKAGIHGSDMARLDSHIDPAIMDIIKGSAIYQGQAKSQGPGAYSEEAAVNQMVNYKRGTPGLQDAIMNLLAGHKQQLKQAKELMK
jgi:hypothetical protein